MSILPFPLLRCLCHDLIIITEVLISPSSDQEGNKLQRLKILMIIYPIYNNNWRNISIYIYIYITRLASNEIFSPSNKIHREVGRAKDLSAPLYILPPAFCLSSGNFQRIFLTTILYAFILYYSTRWAHYSLLIFTVYSVCVCMCVCACVCACVCVCVCVCVYLYKQGSSAV